MFELEFEGGASRELIILFDQTLAKKYGMKSKPLISRIGGESKVETLV